MIRLGAVIAVATISAGVAVLGTTAQAQVITFDDLTLFETSTDAQQAPIPSAGTAFPGTVCSDTPPFNVGTGRGTSVAIPFDSNGLTITQDAMPSDLCIYNDGFVAPAANTTPSTMDGNTIVGNGEDDYEIVFDDPTRVFGLRFLTNDQSNETITFLDESDVPIDTVDLSSLTNDNDRHFFGFYSWTPIKTVQIDTDGGGVQNEGIDRLYVGNNLFEVLYLVDTGTNGDGTSVVYKVGLDEVFDLAILTPIDTAACAAGTVAEGTPGAVDLNHADLLAGTPDGAQLVLINEGGPGTGSNGEIIKLDIATGDCTGILANVDFDAANVNESDQLAYSPAGVLYIGKNDDDEIRTLDPETGVTTVVGVLTDAVSCDTLNLGGSDWTFDNEGDLWVWINNGPTRGLYEVTQANLETPDDGTVCDAGDVLADFIGPQTSIIAGNFTGWATRFNGLGNIAGSNRDTDDVIELDSTDDVDGDVENIFDMVDEMLDPFDHNFGDMSNGPFALCQARSKGFYKTHIDSNPKKDIDTEGVTICVGTGNEELLSEGEIEDILSDAKGKNFSMLAAQTITAILNCDLINDGEWDDDCSRAGYPTIAAAEDFLCSAITDTAAPEWWNQEFLDETQKSDANGHAEVMDAFNNQGHEGLCASFAEGEENGPS